MKSDRVTVIGINSGSGDNRTPEITADVFGNSFWIAFIGFCINIESMYMFFIAKSFNFFKGRSNPAFHFIKKSSAKGITQEGIIKMMDMPPETIIAVTAFREKTMNVRVPFQIPPKGVKNKNKARSEIFRFINLEKHAGNNALHRMKQAVQKRAAFKKKFTKILINGKDTVSVLRMNEFK